MMAVFVAEINSISLPSEIPFSKRNLRSYDYTQLIYILVQLVINFNSTQFRLYGYTKFHLLILGAVKIFK